MENLKKEIEIWEKGVKYIACLDEVGRGPFAGPVVAASVIMPKDIWISGLTDSKKLSKKKLFILESEIKEKAIDFSIGVSSVEEIDEINIKQATRLAMKRAVEGLKVKPEYLLIDGLEVVDLPIEQEYLIKGDLNSHGISAASILAKVYRDKLMADLDQEFSNVYGWAKNAGYITGKHIEACIKNGLSRHHRKSWSTYEKVLSEIKKTDCRA